VRGYFGRKLLLYALTFVAAVTIDWLIPRFMPGDPVATLIAKMSLEPGAAEAMTGFFLEAFGLDRPIHEQYLGFWAALASGDLGISISAWPSPVTKVIMQALPYTLALLIPSILLSFYVGNKFGAYAARRRWADNIVLPVGYILTATPYMWLGIILAWFFGLILGIFPLAGAYGFDIAPSLSFEFAGSLFHHWFLPFMSLFLVGLGGWAIGMRNLIIYELDTDYARYLGALGAPSGLVRKYAYRNALLPQMTGLALSLGVVVAGALVTEVVFAYPGLGSLALQALQSKDYFLLQGIFLFVIVGVLVANFVIDIAYVIVDPRTRMGLQGSSS
jgi:peptide/nickel transport system permease protein